jgi:acetylornithine/succinyldiaminopimelate/putrescine aminotransferase
MLHTTTTLSLLFFIVQRAPWYVTISFIASDAKVWDPEGKQYYDFLSAYSAINQGHCHPDIAMVMTDQLNKLTLSSRAFHNSTFPEFAKYMNETFGYDMVSGLFIIILSFVFFLMLRCFQ